MRASVDLLCLRRSLAKNRRCISAICADVGADSFRQKQGSKDMLVFTLYSFKADEWPYIDWLGEGVDGLVKRFAKYKNKVDKYLGKYDLLLMLPLYTEGQMNPGIVLSRYVVKKMAEWDGVIEMDMYVTPAPEEELVERIVTHDACEGKGCKECAGLGKIVVYE